MTVSAASGIRVLVIDDDELIRMMLRVILQRENCVVIEANNGNKGVALFKQEKPDIVITDILMPDKEGLETISEIRACNTKVKIVAMSGGGNTKNLSFLQMARNIGADHTINKPFTTDDISLLLADLLKK
ncbi:MAG: response regulator [Pseudomonadota bacterium]